MRSILKDPVKEKKGNLAMGLILIASISAFAIFLLIVGFVGKTIGTELQERIGINAEINKSLGTTITTSTVTVNSLWYIMFAGLLLGLFVSAWMMQQYPAVFVPVFIIILITSVIVAVAMSNAYEELSSVAQLGEAAGNQAGVGWIILRLPYVAVVIGLIAIVLAFAGTPGVGGGGTLIQ